MNKLSYISSRPTAHIKPLDGTKTLRTPSSYESTSDSGMIEGSRGLSMPLESTQIPLHNSDDFSEPNEGLRMGQDHKIEGFNDLSIMLLQLGDLLDESRQHRLANFADFLMIKIAEKDSKNYEKLFRLAIISIANSDIINSSKIISNAVEEYSNMIIEGSSYEKAYNVATRKLFISDEPINKSAQILEMNATYVAEQLYKIIKIMLAKISPEKRGKSFKNVADKLSEFNVLDIASKKAPGGAAIGASLGLVKNVLNSKDSYFINVVLKELIKKL